jgi:hypothetical protein
MRYIGDKKRKTESIYARALAELHDVHGTKTQQPVGAAKKRKTKKPYRIER